MGSAPARDSERWCGDCRWFRAGRIYSESVCRNIVVVKSFGSWEDQRAGEMQQFDDGPTSCKQWERAPS